MFYPHAPGPDGRPLHQPTSDPMKYLSTSAALLLALGAAGCDGGPADTVGAPLADAAVQRNFTAHLSGDEEVRTPPVETTAQGQAKLQFSADGSSAAYRVNVAQLADVVGAHLHMAPAGANGPVVVVLLPAPVGGDVNGVLVTGSFTAADLVGPLAGRPLGDLRAAIGAGNVYVNVHTAAYPSGEVRGQVK